MYLETNDDRDRIAFARMELRRPDGKPGKITILAQRPDAELGSFALDDDGTTAALLWNVAGRSELELIDLTTGKTTARPKLPAEIAGGLEFSKDGKSLAMIVSGAATPSDIWILDVATGAFRQVTKSPHAGVDLATLVRPELVEFRAHDGLPLSGWLYRPAAGKAPYPTVLSFHGGPEGQERPVFNSTLPGAALAAASPSSRRTSAAPPASARGS